MTKDDEHCINHCKIVVENETAKTRTKEVVQTLTADLKILSPDNEWVHLGPLNAQSVCDISETGYKKISHLIRAHSDHFDIKSKGSSFRVRRRV